MALDPQRQPRLAIATLLAVACMPVALAQVDPDWLRSWNEAVDARPKTLNSDARIAPADEPGTPLTIHGRIVDPVGKAAPGVIVQAYHRDAEGFDFGPGDDATTTWRLQGWAVTDADGRFTFRTIRPAPDHLGREGAHVHFTLVSERYGRQWASSIYFSDDPLITAAERNRSAASGEFGWVLDVETRDGFQHVEVSLRLDEKTHF